MSYVAKANPSKRATVEILEEKLGKATGIFFTDFQGLSVAEMNRLRSRFFEAGETEYYVAKNTLALIALRKKGVEGLDESVLTGMTGLALGYEDAIKPVKLISDFLKDQPKDKKKPEFKGGVVEGTYYNSADVEKLKDIPPVEQLYAMIIGSMVSPLSGFVGVLEATVRDFLYVLDAIIEEKKKTEVDA